MINYYANDKNKWIRWIAGGGEMPQFKFDRVTDEVVISEAIPETKKPTTVSHEKVQQESKRVLGQEIRK